MAAAPIEKDMILSSAQHPSDTEIVMESVIVTASASQIITSDNFGMPDPNRGLARTTEIELPARIKALDHEHEQTCNEQTDSINDIDQLVEKQRSRQSSPDSQTTITDSELSDSSSMTVQPFTRTVPIQPSKYRSKDPLHQPRNVAQSGSQQLLQTAEACHPHHLAIIRNPHQPSHTTIKTHQPRQSMHPHPPPLRPYFEGHITFPHNPLPPNNHQAQTHPGLIALSVTALNPITNEQFQIPIRDPMLGLAWIPLPTQHPGLMSRTVNGEKKVFDQRVLEGMAMAMAERERNEGCGQARR